MYMYRKPDNLVSMIEESIRRNEKNPLFGTKDGNGAYVWQTYGQIGARIDHLRAGLAQLGVGSGDKIGIIASNRSEWAVAAFATFGLEAQFIPMYEKELVQIWQHIIKDGGIKVLFVANPRILAQIEAIRETLPALKHVYIIDGEGHPSLADLEAQGRRQPVPSRHPSPNCTAVLIYTSGTTGNPKGVLLSHGNFTSNFLGGLKLYTELNSTSRSLSILPWAHSYGQTAELYTFTHLGASIGFMESIDTLPEDIGKVAPTLLIAVPRVFNKIYDGLWNKINAAGGTARSLFLMGLKGAAQKREMAQDGRLALWPGLKYALADKLVFSKIRQRFGGRLRGALTASAMMNQEVAQFFADIGIPVYDCYGLTETSPAVSMNCPRANRPGSVGRPLDQERVKIDTSKSLDSENEGEIVVYGPNVMQGYHNHPEATRAVMTVDGGLRTGDQGRLDEDGYLFITGRIKEQYKLENGKYVFPSSLEEEIRMVPWVENAFVSGEGRPFNICLVVPAYDRLVPWAGQKKISTLPADLVKHPEVHSLIAEAVTRHLGGKFRGYEIPRSFILVEENFSVENGTLTQTLKLKRRRVMERYGALIEAAYA